MNTPKLSVLVAIYNTAPFLAKCLESIINQSLKEIEIVVVNDGATDGSQEIIENYLKRDSRIISVTQKNQGLGKTRNVGIEHAKGQYIVFVDSDDWLEPNYCKDMFDEAIKSNADVVICDYYIDFSDRESLIVSNKSFIKKSKREYIDGIMKGKVGGFSWNKLYRRSLITNNKLSFPLRNEFENVEDQIFSVKSIFLAIQISFVSTPLYHYVQHNNSIVSKYQKDLINDILKLNIEYRRFFKHFNALEEYQNIITSSIFKGVCSALNNERKPNEGRTFVSQYKELKKITGNIIVKEALCSINPKELALSKYMYYLLSKWRLNILLLILVRSIKR